MKKFKSILLFLSLNLFQLFLTPCCAENLNIKTINSITEVKDIFDNASKEDLFVFDVDDVLFEPIEIPKYMISFVQPVEKILIENILNLQKREIKVIALTAFPLKGRFTPDWRYKQILSIGLDFSLSFEPQNLILNELRTKRLLSKNKFPVFYKGIAFSNGSSKGSTLKVLLERLKYKPNRILFFDDKLKFAKSVCEEMKKIKIDCFAFVYKAAITNRSNKNLEIVKLQHEVN